VSARATIVAAPSADARARRSGPLATRKRRSAVAQMANASRIVAASLRASGAATAHA
jgi:hypothetical protein